MSAETMQFKTELKQILDIIIHSLYSHDDIFLRELISNSSDAIDKVRFESLTRHELLEDNSEWKIKIIPDEKNNTLTVSDNGIGMSRQSIIENVGTIAKSGTKAFLENLKKIDAKDRPDLIGQFGVGFYSAFMAAHKVTVVSREAGSKSAGVKWESTGEGDFSVEDVEKETRGTDVILHLREDKKDFLKEWRIREIVKKYSDFVEHPIVMDVSRVDDKENKTLTEETLNSRKAIWLRKKSEVTEDEYKEFYKHLSRDFEDPARTIHYSAEGNTEFRALLYIPAHKPFDFMGHDPNKALHLYIRRVFIMDDCEALLPRYLRFVKGVVDAPDLPLNVSRQTLQQNPILEKIKSNLVNKILGTLEEMKSKEFDAYSAFYEELGALLKEGVNEDWSNREKLADLLLFESTKTATGKPTTLAKYVEGMPAEQQEIFFIIGEQREMIEHSPHLEELKAKGFEVLLMTDPVDEFLVQSLREYKGKKLKAADKGTASDNKVDEEKQKVFGTLLEYMKNKITEVKEVRLSTRLKNSAACLVAADGEMGAHMERLIQRMGRDMNAPDSKRVLEINPDHPAVAAIQALFTKSATDPRLDMYTRLLYDQAVIAEGSKVKDPLAFAQRINDLLAKDAGA